MTTAADNTTVAAPAVKAPVDPATLLSAFKLREGVVGAQLRTGKFLHQDGSKCFRVAKPSDKLFSLDELTEMFTTDQANQLADGSGRKYLYCESCLVEAINKPAKADKPVKAAKGTTPRGAAEDKLSPEEVEWAKPFVSFEDDEAANDAETAAAKARVRVQTADEEAADLAAIEAAILRENQLTEAEVAARNEGLSGPIPVIEVEHWNEAEITKPLSSTQRRKAAAAAKREAAKAASAALAEELSNA